MSTEIRKRSLLGREKHLKIVKDYVKIRANELVFQSIMTKMHKSLEVGISLLLIVVLMPGFKGKQHSFLIGCR